MAEHAPPAWCKLAIHGAMQTERVSLYSAKGWFRAYVPAYHLVTNSNLPKLLRRGTSPEELAERYQLDLAAIDDARDVEIWTEKWQDEPQRIAVGWVTFAEPWDWVSPTLSYEFFEVPSDYSGLFGYDDLHPEGEPDQALYYEAVFGGLCFSVDQAELIAPMCDLERVAFGSVSQTPTKRIGRPKGSGLESSDEPLVREMLAEKRSDPTLTARSLAEKYVGQAAGHGTTQSKMKRLERRLADYGV